MIILYQFKEDDLSFFYDRQRHLEGITQVMFPSCSRSTLDSACLPGLVVLSAWKIFSPDLHFIVF